MNAAALRGAAAASRVLMASAMATTLVAGAEGWVLKGYRDPVGIVTACAGDTSNVVEGAVYSQAECERRLGLVLVEHGFRIAACVPAWTPIESFAAFISFAYNLGAGAFCGSGAAQALKAGNLKLACKRLNESDAGKPQWVTAKGQLLPGLVTRRKAERALCEQGLKA